MDKQTPPPSLPNIRTYAKDLEKKRVESGEGAVTPLKTPPKKISEATDPSDKPANHKYKAPTWTGNKKQPKVPEELPKAPEVTEKEVSTLKPISTPKPTREAHIIVDNEDASSAVIISDTKKSRFRLLPSIFSSLSKWFREAWEKQAAKKIPKYTVPETSRRKGVIQRATSKTGKLTSFDHTSITARIRERQERATPKTPTTVWTANTEPGYPLLEAPEEKITNVQVVPRKSFRTITPEPAAKIEEAKVVETPPPPPPVLVEAKIAPEPVIIEETPTKLTTPLVEREVEEIVINNPTLEPEELVEQSVTKLKPASLREWLFIINTNTISIGVAGIVLFVVIVGAIGYVWYSTQVKDLDIITAPNHPTLIPAPLQLTTVTPLDRKQLLETATSNLTQNKFPVLQILFVDSPAGYNAVPAPKILTTLNPELNTTFTESINYIYFGIIEKNQPFIILRITDSATAKGGMLAWEQTLYKDLEPLFSGFVQSMVSATKELKFKDHIVSNMDIRTLEDSNQRPYMVYGIINQNTLVITNDTTTYLEVAKLIK